MNAARKLIIGLSPRLLRQVPEELGFRGKTLQYLEQSVAHWVMSLDALIVMIPTVERHSLIRRALIDISDYCEALDGLILQGGADVDPAVYGEQASDAIGPIDAARDHFELDLLRAFVARRKPVFGICRGMQLINVAFGGNLHQDLRADQVTSREHVHDEAYERHAHPLRIVEGSWLSNLYGGATASVVNSIHHQGVRRLGEGLVVEAYADDGVVEAIRAHSDAFLVGVQWHPEFHDGSNPDLLPVDPLMRAFLDAVAERKRVGAGKAGDEGRRDAAELR